VCGDGLWDYPEQCDDGNVEAGDGCAPDCVLEAGYYCEYGGSCTLAECGDGVSQSYGDGNGGWAWEECDDANAVSGDGCSSECGLEQGHVCNEPGQPCREVECGDGFQDGYWVPGEGQGTGGSGSGGGGGGGPGGSWVYEACDDANTDSGDGCSSECVVEEGYICDQPGTPCRTPQCGDGFRDWVPGPDPGSGGSAGSGGVIFGGMGGMGGPGEPMHLEGCDDGNQDSGDGCSDECATEDGYVCPEPGQPCRIPVCGDGITDWPYESCDDGNTTDGDYCSSTCQYEWSGSGGAAGSGGSTAGFGSGTGGSWGGGGWGGSG
jgi:cysteine-rich repeat protein